MNEPTVFENVRFIHTMDEIIENGSVRVENGIIESLGKDAKKQRGDEVIDGTGHILMPGLVNGHTHSSMIALRGLNDDAALHDWLESMWEVEDNLTGVTAERASEAAFLEMIRSGTTACLDMYEAFEAVKASGRVGLRMANGPALISRFASAEERLGDTERFAREYSDDPLVIPVVNLHSIYTNDGETISRAAELSRKLGIPLHTHCSETRREVFENRREQGRLAVEELDHHGALWERSVLVHLGWASSWEFNRIAERGSNVIHCPSSNQKLGTGGFFPYRDAYSKGIRIGLGTDSASSNNSLDMFREMRQMALVQKGQYWDPTAATARDALRSATVNGSEIMGLNGGKISEGREADLIMVRIGAPILPLRKSNLESALVYSGSGMNVDLTMVNGRTVYREGRLPDGNSLEERYAELMNDVSERLF